MNAVTVDGAPILPLPEEGLLRASDVVRYISVAKSTWFDWVKKGIAPQPIKIGCATFWSAREIREFIRDQEQRHAA